MDKFKSAVSNFTATTRNVWANASEFVNASCLAAVSGYSGYQALQHIKDNWYRALLFASVVIALEALTLYLRHFNRPAAPVKKK